MTNVSDGNGSVPDWDCRILCNIQRILIVWTGLTLPVYISLLIMIILKRQELNSSFFALYLSTGLADISVTIHKFLLLYLPRNVNTVRQFYMEISWPATLTQMCEWGLYYCQVLGILFIALNRFSAFALPLNYDTIWSGRLITTTIFTQWFCGLAFAFPMFFSCCRARYTHKFYTWFQNENVDDVYRRFHMIADPFFIAPTIVSLYVASYCLARKQNKKMSMSSRSSHSNRKTELKLAVTGAIVTIPYLIMLCCYASSYYFSLYPTSFHYVYYYANDLFTSSSPFVLLACSVKVRRQFLSFISRGTLKYQCSVPTETLGNNRQRKKL